MTINQLNRRIADITDDVCFDYNGITCCICPVSPTRFDMGYGDIGLQCTSVAEIFDAPIFNGKTLRDICDEIELN